MDYVVVFTAPGTQETAMLPPVTEPKPKKSFLKKIGSKILGDPLILLNALNSLFYSFFAI